MSDANTNPELTRGVKLAPNTESHSLIERVNSARGRLILSIAVAAEALFGIPGQLPEMFGVPNPLPEGASVGATLHNPVTDQDTTVGISVAGKEEAFGAGVPKAILDQMGPDSELNIVHIGKNKVGVLIAPMKKGSEPRQIISFYMGGGEKLEE